MLTAGAASSISLTAFTGRNNIQQPSVFAKDSTEKNMRDNIMVIDTHAHVYPKKYLDFLENIGVDPESTKIARNLQASDDDEELEARLAMMDTAGVSKQVISLTPQLPEVDDETDARGAARMANEIYQDIVRKHPDRFLAYGAIPINHPKAALEEIRYCLDELGFAGIAINAVLHDPEVSITDERFLPLFEELNRRKAILYIHPTGHSAHCTPIAHNDLTWVNGAPMEDAIATLQLLKADYPHRFPGIRFHVAHLGGDIPFLARRIEDNYEDWNAFPTSPATTLKKMWFDAANFSTGSLRLATEVFDPSKILAGSDYPYFQDEKYNRAFTYIQEAQLPNGQREAILSHNAINLYDL